VDEMMPEIRSQGWEDDGIGVFWSNFEKESGGTVFHKSTIIGLIGYPQDVIITMSLKGKIIERK
jgi:hypothetical protein